MLLWLALHNPHALVSFFRLFTQFVAGTLLFVWGVTYGALVAGPVADMIKAFLEPLLRPVREWAGVKGAVVFREGAVGIQRMLTDTEKVQAAGDQVKALLAELRSQLKNYDFAGMTPFQASENWARLQKRWIDCNQIWVESLPPYLRDGRSTEMEAEFRQPRNYAQSLAIFSTSEEIHRQAVQSAASELLVQGATAQEIEAALALATRLHAARTSRGDAEASTFCRSQLSALETALATRGIDPSRFRALLDHCAEMHVSRTQVAATMSEWIVQEFYYPEFNRRLPKYGVDERAFEVMKRNLGYEFYLEKVLPDVQRVLDELELKIDAKRRLLEGIRSNLAPRAGREPKAGANPPNAAAA